MLTDETSKALQEIFDSYTRLSIDGKEIVCPYWMNNLEKGIYGPLGGKGKPLEIVQAVVRESKRENIDLNTFSPEEILLFMKMKGIGVDCSGFVFWMLNEFDIEKGGNGISDDIPGAKGLFTQRASVKMLTNENLCRLINISADIKVGDMLQIRRGKHIAIIFSIVKEDGVVKEITYAHCSSGKYTKISGVHLGKIIITDSSKGLEYQKWEETTPEGDSYKKYFFPQSGDGVKRLKNFY